MCERGRAGKAQRRIWKGEAIMALGEKEWSDHAELIGQVNLAWNQVVHQLLRVFCHLTGIESPLAEAIFFGPQSDNAQRRLIKRVAYAVELEAESSKRLAKLLDRIDRASAGRNLAAHIIFGVTMFDPDTGAWGAKVVPALKPAQDIRLEEDFTAQFRRVHEDLSSIYRDLEEWVIHTPFPERPWGALPFPKAAAERVALIVEELRQAE